MLCKVVLFGKEKVGKTKLCKLLPQDPSTFDPKNFDPTYKATIGVDYVPLDLKPIDSKSKDSDTIQFWDTPGQERFGALGAPFYKGTDLFLFCVDMTTELDIRQEINRCLEETQSSERKQGADCTPCYVVLTKSDLLTEEQLNRAKDQLAKSSENYKPQGYLGFFTTSAKTGEGLKALTETIRAQLEIKKQIQRTILTEIRGSSKDNPPPSLLHADPRALSQSSAPTDAAPNANEAISTSLKLLTEHVYVLGLGGGKAVNLRDSAGRLIPNSKKRMSHAAAAVYELLIKYSKQNPNPTEENYDALVANVSAILGPKSNTGWVRFFATKRDQSTRNLYLDIITAIAGGRQAKQVTFKRKV